MLTPAPGSSSPVSVSRTEPRSVPIFCAEPSMLPKRASTASALQTKFIDQYFLKEAPAKQPALGIESVQIKG